MIDELNAALQEYAEKWHKIADNAQDKAFFNSLRPTAVGWKAEDLTDFIARFDELQADCDQVHIGWVNDRWLATMHLKDGTLYDGITLIKLMQRRPESSDATGLDHVDFFLLADDDAKAVLGTEPQLTWTEEKNGDICKWISLWFEGTEAKLRSDTVLQVVADEMLDLQEQLIAR